MSSTVASSNEDLDIITITPTDVQGKPALHFVFQGTLTRQVVEAAALLWKSQLERFAPKPVLHLWNCEQMKGYDAEGRRLWQQAMRDNRAQTDAIWLVSQGQHLKASPMILSAFTGDSASRETASL